MFGTLLSVRLKAAEKALREGRLDEAFRLATRPDLREQRRAGKVRESLARQFLERAREGYRADRFAEALADLDKASAGGVLHTEIDELRSQILIVAAEVKRKAESQRARLADAKRRIEQGSLAAGRDLLEKVSRVDHEVSDLKDHVAARTDDVARIVEEVRHLIAGGQLAAAARRVQRAKSIETYSRRVSAMETDICRRVIDNARTVWCQGKITRARDELACLGSLGDSLPAKREIADLIAKSVLAARALADSEYGDARRDALTLQRLAPQAKWIKGVVSQLEQIENVRTKLGAGPLGECMGESSVRRRAEGPRRVVVRDDRPGRAGQDTLPLPNREGAKTGLADRLLLLVDGGGSYLILRSDHVSIGRAVSDKPADMPILSDIGERHANIRRVDDDYFLFSTKEAEVAGRRTKQQLLRSGDRVVLGQKAKFTFRLPSRRSATAVMDLSDTTKMPRDVRRVVLFSQHATIGQGPSAQISCRHAAVPLLLFEREGALWLRQKNDGHVPGGSVELKIGEPTEIGGVSLVLERWTHRSPGTSSV